MNRPSRRQNSRAWMKSQWVEMVTKKMWDMQTKHKESLGQDCIGCFSCCCSKMINRNTYRRVTLAHGFMVRKTK